MTLRTPKLILGSFSRTTILACRGEGRLLGEKQACKKQQVGIQNEIRIFSSSIQTSLLTAPADLHAWRVEGHSTAPGETQSRKQQQVGIHDFQLANSTLLLAVPADLHVWHVEGQATMPGEKQAREQQQVGRHSGQRHILCHL